MVGNDWVTTRQQRGIIINKFASYSSYFSQHYRNTFSTESYYYGLRKNHTFREKKKRNNTRGSLVKTKLRKVHARKWDQESVSVRG